MGSQVQGEIEAMKEAMSSVSAKFCRMTCGISSQAGDNFPGGTWCSGSIHKKEPRGQEL